jgi:hypothetical protein
MNKLSPDQLDHIAQHIQQTNPHQALQAELLDHLAAQVEHHMTQGLDFQTAFDQVKQQASPQAMTQLKQLYLREFIPQSAVHLSSVRIGARARRRSATKPFQYMLLSNIVAFVILMSSIIWISRPLDVPIGAFQRVWGAGLLILVGLLGVFLVRWRTTRRSHKQKPLRTA